MIETNKIYLGSSLTVLKSFPDECIDMCVTSPPYYGLRSYGTNPQIWDGDENCKHEWKEEAHLISGGGYSDKSTLEGFTSENTKGRELNSTKLTQHGFCIHCNAWKGELGLEPTFQLYLEHLWMIFDEIKRVLKKTGTCWVNLGDSYGGSGGSTGHTSDTKNLGRKTFDYGASPTYANTSQYQPKSLLQIPSRFSIGMTDRGWILRNSIIWYKRNCMPSSARDRFTVDYEMMYFFTKSTKYYFEQQREGNNHYKTTAKVGSKRFGGNNAPGSPTIREDRVIETIGRNKRCVWDIDKYNTSKAHFKHTLDDRYFEDINTEAKAYWLGFLYADGWIGDRAIDLTLADFDIDHVQSFKDHLGSTHSLKQYSNRARIVICSKQMANDLKRHGMDNKLTMPDIPKDLIRHFIRGVFDGDGSIWIDTYGGRMRYGMEILGERQLLESIKQEMKITTNIVQRKGICGLRISAHKQIEDAYNYFYQEATIWLDRKKIKFPQEYRQDVGSLWDITPKGYREAHFAVFPPELVETPIKAGCPEGGIVLDPFFGSGTTGEVATKLNRKFIGIELNEKYIPLAERRLEKAGKLFNN